MQSISQQRAASTLFEEEITAIDDLNEDEEEELREQLDMHSVIVAANHEPFLTAEQVISEIDFMLQDMTPDSGYCDDQSNADTLDLRTRRVKYLSSSVPSDEFDLKTQTIYSLNDFHEELNASIKDLSSLLVQVRRRRRVALLGHDWCLFLSLSQELAVREDLEYEKETKNTFISLVLSIQVSYLRHSRTRSILSLLLSPLLEQTSALSAWKAS